MTNGKQKGGSFEREICKALSLWVSKGQNVDLYWRSAMSGGRATVAKGKVRQAGDITAVAPEGHALVDTFFIECKSYKNLSLDCLIKGKGNLIDFWQIAVKESAKYNRIPLLIFKQNRRPTIVCTSALGVQRLKAELLVFVESGNMHFIKFEQLLESSFPL